MERSMTVAFWIASFVAVLSTALVVTSKQPVHALLNLVLSLVAVAVAFFTLGAPFAAALEVIVYAGAIMVLFVFMIMMLNLGPEGEKGEARMLAPGIWVIPTSLAVILLGLVFYVFSGSGDSGNTGNLVESKEVSQSLFNTYYLAVELASMLLLSGLVGAYHLGKRTLPDEEAEGGAA